jgi:hypothetical protein
MSFLKAVPPINLDGPVVVLHDLQKNRLQKQLRNAEIQQFLASPTDVPTAAGGRRGEKSPYLSGPTQPVDSVHTGLAHRFAIGFDYEKEVVIPFAISPKPSVVLLSSEDLRTLEPDTSIVPIAPFSGHFEIGFRDQPQLHEGISKWL